MSESEKQISEITDFDFADAKRVFEGFTTTYEDDRFSYGEQRFVTLSLLNGVAVSIVHLESRERIHVISFRRATRHEEIFIFKNLQKRLAARQSHERP